MVSYNVVTTNSARLEIRHLPGNMRQQIVRFLETLESEPIPTNTRQMDTSVIETSIPSTVKFYRTRIENWRVIYAIEESLELITVLAIRKRPPYQYENFQQLVDDLIDNHR